MTAPSQPPALQVEPPEPAATALDAALTRYEQKLNAVERDATEFLRALLARDHVDAELRQGAQASHVPPDDRKRAGRQLDNLIKQIEQLGRDHPSYQDALLFEARLRENLYKADRYGDTETLRAERAQVVEQLNSLALAALGLPFNALDAPAPVAAVGTDPTPSHRLVELDTHLRQLAFRQFRALANLPAWRASFSPPETAWWWRLDQQLEADAQERDLLWYLVATTFTVASLTLSVEIIRRLWSGASDLLAIFGTVLTLLLTSSPLLKRGPELGQWIFRRLTWLDPRHRGEMTAAAAALALIGVVLCLLSLPHLGTLYNNRGHSALAAGDLVAAERWFQGASALHPELPVPSYNLAEVYEQSGAPEEAISWFRAAISHDRLFRPSYYRLGAIYNRQGDYAQAEQVLLAGLNLSSPGEDQIARAVNDYLLLANLGWTFFAQERYTRAEAVLQEALQREAEIPAGERRALPHYYLARVACQLGRPDEAAPAIEATLRFVDAGRREGQLWAATAREYLDGVRAGASPCTTLPIVDAP